MQVRQWWWRRSTGWSTPRTPPTGAQLVVAFGARSLLDDPLRQQELRDLAGDALLLACSGTSQYGDASVDSDAIVATALQLERGRVTMATATVEGASASRQAGYSVGGTLVGPELRHVIVIADGLHVDAAELHRGLIEGLPPGVTISGGMAADPTGPGPRLVLEDRTSTAGWVAAIGLTGRGLHVRSGAIGAWEAIGPDRLITRAEGPVLFELDGEPALALHRRYLKAHGASLPRDAARFPIALLDDRGYPTIIRSILNIDEKGGGLVFAGEMPLGRRARLLKANLDALLVAPAAGPEESLPGPASAVALLVAGVGRQLAGRTPADDLARARALLGPECVLTGFGAFAGISPVPTPPRIDPSSPTLAFTALSEL